MSHISGNYWRRVYEETEETKYAETVWPVYEPESYQLCGLKGLRYIRAHKSADETFRREVKFVDPFSPEYAGLFLEFARWFDTQKMEKIKPEPAPTLDTERNAQAALAWAREYGVLGLGTNRNESFAVSGGFFSSSTEIAAEQLGVPHLGHSGTRAYRKSPAGGEHETVEMFVMEAYEANVVLKLYEAATARTVDVPTIARFMSSRTDLSPLPAKYSRPVKSEGELWTRDPADAGYWALAVVAETVTRKIENDVYPILIGEPGSYADAWGFKSLLGAMWLQMRNFMRGEITRCLDCDRLLHKSRRDQVYCDDACGSRYRARRVYAGKKQREQEAREATRRRLQG